MPAGVYLINWITSSVVFFHDSLISMPAAIMGWGETWKGYGHPTYLARRYTHSTYPSMFKARPLNLESKDV